MSLSERLRQLINEKGVTPYEICKITGISQSTLSFILNGKTKKLGLNNSALLSNYFDITREWLNTGKGDKKIKYPRKRVEFEFGNVGGDFNTANENGSIHTETHNHSEILKAELGKCKEELSRLKDIIMEKDKELIELYKKRGVI